MLKRFLPFFVIGLCLLIVTDSEEVKVTKCVSLEDAGSYQITKEYVVHSRKEKAIRYIINTTITSDDASILDSFRTSYEATKNTLETYEGISITLEMEDNEFRVKELYEYNDMDLAKYALDFPSETYINGEEVKEDDLFSFLNSKGLTCEEVPMT